MTPETFGTAMALDARIRNLAASNLKTIQGGDLPYKIDLTGLCDTDRGEIRAMVLDYLKREESRARASFDAL
jgi:hypothetical protein